MRSMAFLLVIATIPAPLIAQEVELPAWMAGCWELREGERWAEECWTVPRAGMMMGSGRTGTGERTASWEFMRIERGEAGLTFSASPGGAPWTSFSASEGGADGLVFTNAANDYPQRVRYWREGETLNAEISLEDGSRAMRWSFRRMGG